MVKKTDIEKLFEIVPSMVCVARTDGYFKYLNPEWEKVLGYSQEELLSRPIFDFIHPDDHEPTQREIDRQIKGEMTLNFKNRYRCKDGSYKVLEWRATAAEGNRLYAVAKDITESKNKEEALRKSQKMLARTEHIANIGSWEWEVSTDTVLWSEELFRIFQIDPDGNAPSWAEHPKLYHPEDFKELRQALETALESGKSYELVLRALRKDGKIRICKVKGFPEIGKNGDVVRLFGFLQDITDIRQTEKELQKSRERYRRIFENLQDVYYEVDAGGTILEVSPSIENISQYTREILIGKSLYDIYTDPKERDEFIRIVLDKGKVNDFEISLKDMDDSQRLCSITALLVRDSQGLPINIIGSMRDISKRKQAENALKDSEERFRLAFHTSPDSINLNRLEDGVYIDINDGFTKILGYTREDAIGKSSLFLNIWKNPEDRKRLVDGLMKTGYVENMEAPFVGKDGKIRYGLMSARITKISGENIIISITRDITERKRSEDAFESQNTLLSMIMETSPVGITTVDVEGSITYANYRAEQILGIEKNTITTRKYDSPEWRHTDINGEPLQDEKQPFNIVKTTGKPAYNIQHGITWPDGRSVILSINASPMKDKEGQFAGMVATFEDITERKQAEAEREKLQAQLIQAQKMESVGRLAGGVAHDFNNMLSIILGNTEMAMEGITPDDPLHDNLSEIFSAALRSADITRQLLAFARKQTIAPKVLDLNRTIKSMLKMLRRLIGEDIDLLWLPEKKVWPVRMDPSQLDQILANLCVNARDAIAGVGKITIETGTAIFDSAYCSEHPGFVPGDFVLLVVSDDGCGMDEEILSKLFEPFFTTKDADKGTGLGLATVYGIVKQNDGFINVYSEPDQGTTFRVYLPRYLPEAESPEKKISDKLTMVGTETILLVEDEPSILKMTKMMLERTGYMVLAAGTPGEAIALAREHAGEIHLLMTDVVMPEMNGRDLAKNLFSLYPNLKRLFMSGYTANVIAHHGVLDEGVNFIQKPFSKEQLGVKVREVLDDGTA